MTPEYFIRVKLFVPHAFQLGFSLNVNRFLATLNKPPTHPSRPHPALLNAICLWATYLSRDSSSNTSASANPQAQEQHLLDRTVVHLTSSLGSPDPVKRIQALQTELLLAQYYFCNGRFLEGRYHANSAVSLAVSCGLHRIRSSEPSPSPTSSPSALMGGVIGTGGLFDLAQPRDMVEEGERINTFWSVFNVDRCWAVATGTPTMLYDDAGLGTQIDTPWPLAIEDYERVSSLVFLI